MEGACREKGLTFAVEGGLSDHRPFLGDPGKLKQVLVNLCSNAVKFTESGGVRVLISDEHSTDGRDTVTLAVVDTGIGIPKAKLSAIFDKFSQADSSISRKYGGTGLGLAISRTLTELMSGSLTVESREGEGSTFTVRLTLDRCDAVAPENAPLAVVDADAARQRILLVEDHPANVLVATSLLEAMGYICDVAGTGIEALERLAERNDYAVILMDVQMPGMDGLEATRRIRALNSSEARQIAIIGMTAHALMGDRERCLDAGMDDYIPKPFAPATFEAKLADVIQRVRSNGAREPA
jgi:CheY-like chemotaxis protein